MATMKIRSPLVLAFVREYVWGEHAGNGQRCALLAGFSKNRPELGRKYAWQLLQQKNVKEMIAAESAEKEAQIKQKWTRVLEEAFHMATSDIGELLDENHRPIPLYRLPLSVRRAILSIEVEHRTEGRGEDAEHYTVTKIKMHPKQPAVDFVAKVAGKLTGNVEIEANGGGAINIRIVRDGV